MQNWDFKGNVKKVATFSSKVPNLQTHYFGRDHPGPFSVTPGKVWVLFTEICPGIKQSSKHI